jgi:hypothetical protein
LAEKRGHGADRVHLPAQVIKHRLPLLDFCPHQLTCQRTRMVQNGTQSGRTVADQDVGWIRTSGKVWRKNGPECLDQQVIGAHGRTLSCAIRVRRVDDDIPV